ncbi:type IV pilin protein [Pseudoalteromonas sp. bablab_jr011]|uniref:type IV pilin protein n=1 Tax=Pseudoalteromonas sp. bablab_jr011 TaxID=2755062 RepID=UPI0018F312A8|nr:type IV pilin protein [Pseudoalteromonas sp. bablab_jr011]
MNSIYGRKRFLGGSGFTLIELMIVLAITAILATIAFPSYQNYIQRSHAKVAGTDLVALSVALENRFQRQLNYAGATTNNVNWHQASKNYTITMSLTSSTYTLKASSTNCTLTLSHSGIRTISGHCGGLTSW